MIIALSIRNIIFLIVIENQRFVPLRVGIRVVLLHRAPVKQLRAQRLSMVGQLRHWPASRELIFEAHLQANEAITNHRLEIVLNTGLWFSR
jgi:hypothetical protein